MQKYKTTLEYKKNKSETPFETFLKYTDEKERSSERLAEVLDKYLVKEPVELLDIGTGNGEYLLQTFLKSRVTFDVSLDLLEPSSDLIKVLRVKAKKFPENCSINIIKKTWEEFEPQKRYDVILASHLYHISREDYFKQFKKMIGYLKSRGLLILVMRDIDDPYHFKMKFKSKLFGDIFRAKTLDESLQIFNKLSKNEYPLEIERYTSVSELQIPYKTNKEDSIAIIEFYLNKRLDEVPADIQKEIWNFIEEKNGKFIQYDGIAVIKRLT